MRLASLVLCSTAVLASSVTVAQTAPKPQVSEQEIVCRYDPTAADCDQGASRGFKIFQPGRPDTAAPASAKAPASTAAGPPRPQASRVKASPAPARLNSAAVSRNDLIVTFANASSELTPQARSNIAVFARAVNGTALANRRFEIAGHTNQIGSKDYNDMLSQRRANAVIDYLASLGVDRSRLSAKGYGFTRPLSGVSPRNPRNRRVEAELVRS